MIPLTIVIGPRVVAAMLKMLKFTGAAEDEVDCEEFAGY
jgi:hypothetical protein